MAHINKPFWQQKTFWLSIGSGAAFGTELLNQITPFLPVKYAHIGVAIGGILVAIGTLAARQGGVQAAKEVAADSGKVIEDIKGLF